MEEMSLREKILKTFVVTIREVNKHGGPKEFFEKYPVGGFFFREAAGGLDENGVEIGTGHSYEKYLECVKASKKKLFVCADGVPLDGAKNLRILGRTFGASKSIEDAYELGRLYAINFHAKNVDMILGPSMDLCIDPLMYLHAVSDDPKFTAELYKAQVKGIQDNGICATSKHFPGLGTYFVNMHMSPGANKLDFDTWMETYGYTYKELINAGVMAIMTTHVTLKSYDSEGDHGFYPIATFSPKLTTELLKEKLGFKGVVITDALIMGGNATGDDVAEAVQAFRAGADLLLWPPVEAAEKIEELILSGDIPMSRLDDALERIGRLEEFRNKAIAENKIPKPDIDYVDKKMVEIVKRGVCLLRNDIGLLPINKEKHKKIVVVDGSEKGAAPSTMLLKDELERRGFEVDVVRDIYDTSSTVCWQPEINAIQDKYDLAIINMDCNFVAQWSVAHMLIWASHMFDKKKKVIVNYGSPYFASEYFPEDPTYVEMNCKAHPETVKFLVDGLLGEVEFTGTSIFTKEIK